MSHTDTRVIDMLCREGDQARLAALYRALPDWTDTPRARTLASQLSPRLWKRVLSWGGRILFCKEDPPGGIERVRYQVRTGALEVFSGGTHSRLLSLEDNLLFRAVHDLDHVASGGDFSLRGEILAYQYAARSWGRGLESLLFSEIVLQAADTLEQGAFSGTQKVVLL